MATPVDGSREVRATAGLGLTVGKSLQGYVGYEASLGLRLLPRCPFCGGKHPSAYQPPEPADVCPSCGAPAGVPGSEIEVPAVLTGRAPSTLAARACLAIGSALRRLAERFQP